MALDTHDPWHMVWLARFWNKIFTKSTFVSFSNLYTNRSLTKSILLKLFNLQHLKSLTVEYPKFPKLLLLSAIELNKSLLFDGVMKSTSDFFSSMYRNNIVYPEKSKRKKKKERTFFVCLTFLKCFHFALIYKIHAIPYFLLGRDQICGLIWFGIDHLRACPLLLSRTRWSRHA